MGAISRTGSLFFLAVLAGCGGGSFHQDTLQSQPHITIVFDSPSQGTQIIGNSVTISARAKSDEPVRSLRLLMDGNFLAMANGPAVQGTFSVAPGKHYLEAIAVGAQENRNFAFQQFDAVNKLQLVTNLPVAGSVLPSPLNISASVPQPNAGTKIMVDVDGKPVFVGGTSIAPSVPLTLGEHQITLLASDETG
jgi:hypothetical protein